MGDGGRHRDIMRNGLYSIHVTLQDGRIGKGSGVVVLLHSPRDSHRGEPRPGWLSFRMVRRPWVRIGADGGGWTRDRPALTEKRISI